MNERPIRQFSPSLDDHLTLTGQRARIVDRSVLNGGGEPCFLVLVEASGFEYPLRYRADGIPLRPDLAAAIGGASHDFRLVDVGSWRPGDPMPREPEGFEPPRSASPGPRTIERPSMLAETATENGPRFPMLAGKPFIQDRVWEWDRKAGALVDSSGRRLVIVGAHGQAFAAGDADGGVAGVYDTPEAALFALRHRAMVAPIAEKLMREDPGRMISMDDIRAAVEGDLGTPAPQAKRKRGKA